MTQANTQAFEFMAEVYDAVYRAKGKDYEAEARRIAQLVAEHRARSEASRSGPQSPSAPTDGAAQPGSRRAGMPHAPTLLDVACGTGEHLRHLRAHFHCTGVDRSPAMLAVARRKLPDVDLHEADMTDFDLGRRFDAITCLFASIAYLPDADAVRRAVARMAAHLAPGGLLLIEPGVTPDRLQPPRRSTLTARVGDAEIRRVTDARVHGDSLIIHFDHEVRTPANTHRFQERHTVRLFDRPEYEAALEAAALTWRLDPHGLTGQGLYLASREM